MQVLNVIWITSRHFLSTAQTRWHAPIVVRQLVQIHYKTLQPPSLSTISNSEARHHQLQQLPLVQNSRHVDLHGKNNT